MTSPKRRAQSLAAVQPRSPPRGWRALRDSWALRSATLNAFGSALDYSVALSLVSVMGVATPLGTAAGVMTGATFNFFANRRFAFGDASCAPVGRQALRFVTAIGTLMVIHALAVWMLRDRLGVPFVPAKMAADVVLLGATQPFVLRYFVFTRPPAPAVPALAQRA